jgi:hypothetical protein
MCQCNVTVCVLHCGRLLSLYCVGSWNCRTFVSLATVTDNVAGNHLIVKICLPIKQKFLELQLVKNVKPRVQSCSEGKEHSPVLCESNIVRKGLQCRSKLPNKAAVHNVNTKNKCQLIDKLPPFECCSKSSRPTTVASKYSTFTIHTRVVDHPPQQMPKLKEE